MIFKKHTVKCRVPYLLTMLLSLLLQSAVTRPHVEAEALVTPFMRSQLKSRGGSLSSSASKIEKSLESCPECRPENNNARLRTSFVAETELPTDIGSFRLRAYRITADVNVPEFMGHEPCVIYSKKHPPGFLGGGMSRAEAVPIRVHDQCFTSEVFRSLRCDCKEQLNMALRYVNENGGLVIYLPQEGRGIGLANKVAAYALQDGGMDTVDANLHLGLPEDARQYGMIPDMLMDMGIDSIQLLTNNPMKVERLRNVGVDVKNTIPMVVDKPTKHNRRYLQTKYDRMNHFGLGDMLNSTLDMNTNGYNENKDDLFLSEILNGSMQSKKKRSYKKDSNGRTKSTTTPSSRRTSANIVSAESVIDAKTAFMVPKAGASLPMQTNHLDENKEQTGVTAAVDGYCFGRASVEEAIDAVSRGEVVVVVDDEDRENEGDFIMAADLVTPESMATIVRYSSGVVCVAMEGERLDELKIGPMVQKNQDPKGTAFGVTVDATKENGITTGISARERAITIRLLADPTRTASDFNRPGHIFPLRSKKNGVLHRDGHTEASVDLARMAGCQPVGVLCEIVSDENPTEMMRLPEIKRFCKRHGFVMTSIVDLAQYRRDTGL